MTDALPLILQEIAYVAGHEAAWILAGAHGGTNVYFPATVTDQHWLAQLVGLEAAKKLCLHFRDSTADLGHVGRRLLIPRISTLQARRAWERVLESDATLREAAQLMGVYERTVSYQRARRRKSNHKKPGKQGDLF